MGSCILWRLETRLLNTVWKGSKDESLVALGRTTSAIESLKNHTMPDAIEFYFKMENLSKTSATGSPPYRFEMSVQCFVFFCRLCRVKLCLLSV